MNGRNLGKTHEKKKKGRASTPALNPVETLEGGVPTVVEQKRRDIVEVLFGKARRSKTKKIQEVAAGTVVLLPVKRKPEKSSQPTLMRKAAGRIQKLIGRKERRSDILACACAGGVLELRMRRQISPRGGRVRKAGDIGCRRTGSCATGESARALHA